MEMFGHTRSNPIEDLLDFHSSFDRFFNQVWNELPMRTSVTGHTGFQVRNADDAWKVSVAIPGIDPKNVVLDVSGTTVSIRAAQSNDTPYGRFEQTLTVPSAVDTEKITAAYRFGVLELTLPWKDSVKPRRIQIEHAGP